ncbi:hypothetical protein AV926_17170 [Myroides marinus]|uniref:Lipoprotein n=1 Tax=Myroides marinus TaxID=703342 RepID=A0A163VPY0_9FLAO|nr:hypothetical protein [Myroides marinus]KZE75226.1 hypothetical protein AV926_17170 [Myroides marinus]
MKKLILLSLLFISTLFTSCNTSSNHYWIDNPTNEPITVYIDDTAYEIPAMTKIEIDLEYGKHQLKYNGQELTFHNGGRVNKEQAIINPTQSTYVFMAHKFINENDERATDEYIQWAQKVQSDSLRLKVNDTITTIFVPFKITNQLFIKKGDFDWQYNIEEPMPEGITLSPPIITSRNRSLQNDPNYQAGKFQETLFKLYREQEFKDYVKQASDDKIEFLLEKTPYAELPKLKIELTKLKDITDPEYKQKLEDHVHLFYQWLDMKGSKSTTGFKEVLMGQQLTTLRSEFSKKHSDDYSFNQATNEFDDQMTPFMRYQLNIIDNVNK